jgi:hypothetical protein
MTFRPTMRLLALVLAVFAQTASSFVAQGPARSGPRLQIRAGTRLQEKVTPDVSADDEGSIFERVKALGVPGAVSLFGVKLTTYAIAIPAGYVGWHASTGEWLDPTLLLSDGLGDAEAKARLLGLWASYYLLLKVTVPFQLGAAYALAPFTRTVLESSGVMGNGDADGDEDGGDSEDDGKWECRRDGGGEWRCRRK